MSNILHVLNSKVLQGNTDNVNPEGRILDPSIIARFIKINVKTFQGYPSLRVELYGCIQGTLNFSGNFVLRKNINNNCNIIYNP